MATPNNAQLPPNLLKSISVLPPSNVDTNCKYIKSRVRASYGTPKVQANGKPIMKRMCTQYFIKFNVFILHRNGGKVNKTGG